MNLSGVDMWLPLGFGFFAGLAIIAMVGKLAKVRSWASPVCVISVSAKSSTPNPWLSIAGVY
jgi:hypothetical protein